MLDSGEEFALILSDLMMAEMDGDILLERAKEQISRHAGDHGYGGHDISVALSAIRNGAYDYLLKPFERDQLLKTAKRALENRRLRLENRAFQLIWNAGGGTDRAIAPGDNDLQQNPELKKSYDITLEALGDALDLKDAETEGHSKRVTAFTIAIARAMGLRGRDSRDRPRRLPARHRQDGHS